MRVVDLTPGTRALLAPVCAGCAWWQTPGPPAGRPQRRRPPEPPGAREAAWPHIREQWERDVSHTVGLFGKVLTDGDSVLGWLHAAPAPLVPRAAGLAAGPPSRDAWLLACAYLYDEDYLHGFQRLLLELMGDLKARNVEALEAFALCPTCLDDRFRGYLRERNLFNHETLEGNGFRPVRLVGNVARYRLELSTLVAVPRHARLLEAWERMAAQPI